MNERPADKNIFKGKSTAKIIGKEYLEALQRPMVLELVRGKVRPSFKIQSLRKPQTNLFLQAWRIYQFTIPSVFLTCHHVLSFYTRYDSLEQTVIYLCKGPFQPKTPAYREHHPVSNSRLATNIWVQMQIYSQLLCKICAVDFSDARMLSKVWKQKRRYSLSWGGLYWVCEEQC